MKQKRKPKVRKKKSRTEKPISAVPNSRNSKTKNFLFLFEKNRGAQNLIKSLNIKSSINAKASPWQNGYQKSFYSGFKLELGHPEAYSDLGELYGAIARQIYYYNNLRIHSALKYPPAVFAQKINCSNHKLINPGNHMRLFVKKIGTWQKGFEIF